MNRQRTVILIILVMLKPPNGFSSDLEFASQIQPLLTRYCQRCHGPEEANSKIRVDILDHRFGGKQLFVWDKIIHVLTTDDADFRMPPEDEAQPSESERELLTRWIAKELKLARKKGAVRNGHARRLTKIQYRNTLRDLLLLDEDLTAVLPDDATTKEGYNSAEVMQISPMHMEYYFDIAIKALDRVIVDETKQPQIHNFRINLGAGINKEDFQEELILGANSRLIPVADFTVEELKPKKTFPFSQHRFQRKFSFIEGYIGNGTIRQNKDFDSIYHNVFACLRGQGGYPKGQAETMIKAGLLLRPSVPNTEIFRMGSTYGPSPNFKISLRELPQQGNFRVKVRASKHDDAFVLDRGHPAYDQKLNQTIVFDATKKNSRQLEIPSDGIYQVDMTYLSKQREDTVKLAFGGKAFDYGVNQTRSTKLDVITVATDGKLADAILIQDPQAGKRSINLAEIEILSNGKNIAKNAKLTFSSEHYENVAAHLVDGNKNNLFHTNNENTPWVGFAFDRPLPVDSVVLTNSKNGNRKYKILGVKVTLSHGDHVVHRHVVTPTYLYLTKAFKLLELKQGKVNVDLTTSHETSVKQVLLSRLDDDDPLVAVFNRFKKRNPQLGVHLGFRRDCGSALSQVGEAQAISSDEPRYYYFQDAINNYPISVMVKGNKNYLAGVSEIGVRNEYLDGRDAPRLLIHSVEFEGPFYESWPPKAHQNIFLESKHQADREKYAAEVIQNFMKKAYRRPATHSEFSQVYGVWDESYRGSNDFIDSIKDALIVVLCSPQVLLITEASLSEQNEDLTDYEFASKLSYFLWNSCPDEELLNLAETGRLRESLDSQIDRMLADPKSQSFFRRFAFQWLNLDRIDTVETNVTKYPRLTKYVKKNLQQESIKFIEYLVKQNLELKNIIDSDFTLANDVVAGYYGIAGHEHGMKFKKTRLPKKRGGILAQAGILAGLSDGNESNPVKRGNWVARKIVSEPPGDPPANVPDLEEVKGDFTLREKLERHRSQTGCVKCHTKIDPWGIPFEEFDAAGIFKPDADSVSELPDGRSIRNLMELKEYLLTDKMDQVAVGFMQHLSIYALGRSLTFKEIEHLKTSGENLKTDGYRVKDIIKMIVNSEMYGTK